jgi:hypothetical protein
MKKIFLLLCIISVTLTAYSQKNLISLNGYHLNDATTMAYQFITRNTVKPSPECVWFSKDVIHKMLVLLNTEKAPNGQMADGIRIYFGFVNNQNTVIMVSTYAYSSDNVPSKTKHQDYFQHDDSNDLFTTTGINGEVYTKALCGNGCLLFQKCVSPCPNDKACDPKKLHYITRSRGEKMVGKFGTTPIVTSSEWFDICLFQAIDDENKYDGVRIYFGKHLPTDLIDRNKEAFVVVTTTGASPDNQTDDFNCYLAQKCINAPAVLNSYVKTYLKKVYPNISKQNLSAKIKSFIAEARLNGQDNGEICPDHCDGLILPHSN